MLFSSFFFFAHYFQVRSNTSICAPTLRLSRSFIPGGRIFSGFIEWEDRLDSEWSSDWIFPLRLATYTAWRKAAKLGIACVHVYFCLYSVCAKHLVVVFVLHKVEREPYQVHDSAIWCNTISLKLRRSICCIENLSNGCPFKEVNYSDETTEKYQLTPQFPSVQKNILASSSSLSWLTVTFHLWLTVI